MPQLALKGIKDSPNLQPVSVIASFDVNGHVKPLYVRLGEESLKVHSSWIKPDSYASVCIYECQVIDNGVLKTITLNYHHHDKLWCVPKAYQPNKF